MENSGRLPNWDAYEAEVVELAAALVQADTSNPANDPSEQAGNETRCAEILAARFEADGIETEVIERTPGRGNVVARLRGSGNGPSLLLFGHLDVAPVPNPDAWTHPPFSAAVDGGEMWGRGTVDMKSLVAQEAVTLLYFAREALPLAGDLMFASVADEKTRGPNGAQHLLRARPETVTAPYVINEGGGFPIKFGSARAYVIDVAERGMMWLDIGLRGRAGHSSMPGSADNALTKAAEIAARLSKHEPRQAAIPLVRSFFAAMLRQQFGSSGDQLAELWFNSPNGQAIGTALIPNRRSRGGFDAMLGPTISPNTMRANGYNNVVPDTAWLGCDCRFLPGQGRAEVYRELREVGIDLDAAEINEVSYYEGSESPVDNPFFQALAETLGDIAPGWPVEPFLLPTASDSTLLRENGSIVYGFQPVVPGDGRAMQRVHQVDERLSLDSIIFGADALIRVAKRVVGDNADRLGEDLADQQTADP
jgi:acetylornithine deacetylase/succinyl-diaminopimelate desuccinylase-like protein